MTDASKIESVLTPEEWAEDELGYRAVRRGAVMISQRVHHGDPTPLFIRSSADRATCTWSSIPVLIALANASLSDDDPRKITRDWVETLRTYADALVSIDTGSDDLEHAVGRVAASNRMRRFAAALESYLPPGTPGANGGTGFPLDADHPRG